LAAFLGALLGALSAGSLRTAALVFLVFVPAGIFGAWLWRRAASNEAAP
jgi:hypothetical protein